MPIIELERTFSPVDANASEGVSVMPQFVSILNSEGSKPFIEEQTETAFSPVPPPLPPPCFVKPPLPKPPCVGLPPKPCYGKPPCVGVPPCYGGCYGG